MLSIIISRARLTQVAGLKVNVTVAIFREKKKTQKKQQQTNFVKALLPTFIDWI